MMMMNDRSLLQVMTCRYLSTGQRPGILEPVLDSRQRSVGLRMLNSNEDVLIPFFFLQSTIIIVEGRLFLRHIVGDIILIFLLSE